MDMAKEQLFSQAFPDADPAVIMKEAKRIPKMSPIDTTVKIPSLEELIKNAELKYSYRSRPDAKEKSERFISLAKEISAEYKIDTEITQGDYSITADLFLYYAPYAAGMKRDIDRLVQMADTLSLFGNIRRPNGIVVSLDYYTHDRFLGDKKIEWY